MAAKPITPQTFHFTDDGSVPNNPLPFLVYKSAVDLSGAKDPAAAFEQRFAANGWGESWRNGIFDFVHYHSQIHEVLGIARGTAKVRFGGNDGAVLEIAAGDVAVLPAGTGHQKLSASADLLVVGAYPPQGTYDLCRGGAGEHAKALATIPNVPPPRSDPLYGEDGPLVTLWSMEP
ncbi:MAG: hypothetical protein AB7O60_06975 [Variibacter sp.]